MELGGAEKSEMGGGRQKDHTNTHNTGGKNHKRGGARTAPGKQDVTAAGGGNMEATWRAGRRLVPQTQTILPPDTEQVDSVCPEPQSAHAICPHAN